jgi:hypothetical protein
MSQNKYHGLLLPAVVIMAAFVASVATPKSAFGCGDGVNCDPPSEINLGSTTTNQGGNGFGGTSTSNVESNNRNVNQIGVESRLNLDNRINPTNTATGGTGGDSESRSGSNATATGGQSTANGGNPTGTGGGGGSVNLKGGLNLVLPNTATPQGPTQPGTGFASFSVGRNACTISAIIAGSNATNNSSTFWVFNTSSGQSSPSEEVKANGSLAFQAAISMATGKTSILPGEGCDTPKPVTVPSQELVPPVVVPPAPKGVCTPGQAGNGAYLRNGVYVCAR